MKVGIVRFPGTNCDRDMWMASEVTGHQPQWLWHRDRFQKSEIELVVLAGGFSYGDYLRSGALASMSPVMESVKDFADSGRPVLGICNGFQILCETQLLPGALLKNASGLFVDEWSLLQFAKSTPFNRNRNGMCCLPVAHGDGRYFHASPQKLFDEELVWLTYKNNPNGSVQDIAGVTNAQGNVCGLMPHPERAMFDWMGGTDGSLFWA